LKDYELRPYRSSGRKWPSEQRSQDIERTQFRALGWSLRYGRKLTSAADYALALVMISLIGGGLLCLLSVPVFVVLEVVRLCA
jgi:hypothetical protein